MQALTLDCFSDCRSGALKRPSWRYSLLMHRKYSTPFYRIWSVDGFNLLLGFLDPTASASMAMVSATVLRMVMTRSSLRVRWPWPVFRFSW